MERADRPTVGTFHAPGAWSDTVELGDAAARHAAVKRLRIGDPVRLTSGDGRRAAGEIRDLTRRALVIGVASGSIETVGAPPLVELWAPVGDRERMLLLAEKAVELGASAWRPVMYHRSRSVSPRGEGDGFREKLLLRMINALEQCGAAWLPAVHSEVTLDAALRDSGRIAGVLLDAGAEPLVRLRPQPQAPLAIALGPEGGLEPAEHAQFVDAGWRTASLGGNVLRFETAGIAALALVRSLIP